MCNSSIFPKFLYRIHETKDHIECSNETDSVRDEKIFFKSLFLWCKSSLKLVFSDKFNNFKLSFLSSGKIFDPIELFTDDIYSWSHSFSDILCNSIKNSFDIIFFTLKLSSDFGWRGPISIMVWYLFSGIVLRFLTSPLGENTAIVRNLEYEYRDLYTNINENAEQLAFYKKGTVIEKERLLNAFEVII